MIVVVSSKSYLQIRDKQRVVLYLNFYILTTWLYKTFYDTRLALHVSYKAFTIFSLPLLGHVSVLISTCSANPRTDISPRNRGDKTDCESAKKAWKSSFIFSCRRNCFRSFKKTFLSSVCELRKEKFFSSQRNRLFGKTKSLLTLT